MKKRDIALIVSGAFLLTTGVLSRTYAYENVAVAPATPEIDVVATTAPGEPATYFDIGQLREVQAALENRTRIRGNTSLAEDASAELDRDVVVWDAYACTGPVGQNCLTDDLPLAGNHDVAAMTPHDSEVVEWSGAFNETGGERTPSELRGSVYKLPFGVEKRDYEYWNGAVGIQVPLTYEGVDDVDGLTVYNFSQTVPPTKVGTIDLPGSLVGSDQPTVNGDRMASSTSTYAFEPETGVAMTVVSSLDNYVEVDGEKVLTTTRGTFNLDDATVAANVETYRSLASQLHLVRVVVPVVGISLGTLLLAVGLWFGLRRRPAA